ncbi:alpha/beta fold hydrolase [Terriglobus aquaticus]|uniref:Alpha/beta fold hydrolase n=1 Tax=Terriglobus aquaticus TaxID=940139 RepID=A0ABW9KNA8_9BACT|nr:alpha/beta hydrolase [Terriglobus aquaticus]
MPYFQAKDGTNIYFYDWGAGAPVVLIHGWPLSSASWEYQARVLADSGFRVIAYDRRGFGRSDWAARGYDYDTLASDLNDLMEGLNLSGATLVGFSMGGGEVARYIARYGESRVAKAAFVSAVTPYLLKTDDNPDGVDRKVFEDIYAHLIKDRPAFLQSFAEKFFNYSALHHTVSSAQLQFAGQQAFMASPDATLKLAHAWAETDFRGDATKITVPTLIIHGTSDKLVPIEHSGARMKSLVANSELLEYDGEPHGLTNTAPDKLNEDLLRFLRAPGRVAAL